MKRAGSTVPALAEVVERQAERSAELQDPLEMGRLEPECPALDSALGRHQRWIRFTIGIGRSRTAPRAPLFLVDDAELVHQDLLRFARRPQRVGVDDAVQRSEEKLIRK